MSIAFQQKNLKVTLNILEYIFGWIDVSTQYSYSESLYMFDGRFNDNFEVNKYLTLTKVELSIFIYAGIIKKINNQVNIMQYVNQHSGIGYLLESESYSKYSKSKIGRISFKNKNADSLINIYNTNIHKLENIINGHTDLIINRINKLYTIAINNRLNDTEQTKTKQIAKIKENEKTTKDLENFKIFLSSYCDIGEADIAIILKNIPGYISCENICYATNSFLNNHIPVRFVKNISDALSGIPNKYNQCPLCFIYDSGGPLCTKHMVYKDAKSNNKCAVCMQNNVNIMVKCNHEFCKSCIDKWLENNSTCPLCRDFLK